MNTALATKSGKLVDLHDPSHSQIVWMDIAEHLAKTARFNGATFGAPYSVAQHSCLVADHVPTGLRLHALLHDAHEAFLTDWTTPLKNALRKECEAAHGALMRLEDRMLTKIHNQAGIALPAGKSIDRIKQADEEAFSTEVRDLMYSSAQKELQHLIVEDPWKYRIKPWKWPEAVDQWMDRLNQCLDNPEFRTGATA